MSTIPLAVKALIGHVALNPNLAVVPDGSFLQRLRCSVSAQSCHRDIDPTDSGAHPKPGLIDLHHHILPPFYLSEVRDLMLSSWKLNSRQESYLPTRVLEWSPQNALAEMDKNGVATSVVSISIPGIWFGGAQAARTSARKCNEYAAHLVQDHPGRFAFFASAPLPDTEGSLQEIAYALDVLKASGFIFMTNYADKWPGDPAYALVFEELNRLKSCVFPSERGELLP